MNRVSPNTKASPALAVIIGRNVRELRIARGINQSALARLCGMSQAEVSFIEHSKRTPSIKTLLRLCDSLGCDLMDLLP